MWEMGRARKAGTAREIRADWRDMRDGAENLDCSIEGYRYYQFFSTDHSEVDVDSPRSRYNVY